MDNLKYKNSFTDDFNNKKYKYPITNPPYGGDVIKKKESINKRDKVKEYIKKEILTITDEELIKRRQTQIKNIEAQEKQEKKDNDKQKVSIDTCSTRIQKFAKDNGLNGNDKESCSLMLLMDILEVGGTAIGVLKEGVFFNSNYKKLRKCLVDNFNVREVISIPQDQFENTSTKTSIIIFDNTEETTTEVKFSDLVVERYTEDKFEELFGNIVIIENKDDINNVTDKLKSVASKEEILENTICSLDGKNYNKKEIVVGKGYELVKLGDIVEFLQKSKRKANDGKQEGKYNFYTSSDKVKKCDIADYNTECLIIGSGGVANIKIDSNFSCSTDNFILKTVYNTYLFSFIKGNMSILSDGFIGSTLKHISKDYLINIKIPIPKSEDKIKEWVEKISKPYDEKKTKQTKINELNEYIQNRLKEIEENEECDEVNLGNICAIWSGKNLTKEKAINGKYNVYGGGNSSYTHNEYNLKGFNIIISRVGNNGIMLINEELYLTDNGFSLIIHDNSIKKYVGYYILNNKDTLLNIGNGSAQKVIAKHTLSKIKIKIPKNKKIIQDLEPTFNEIEKLNNEVKKAEEKYKQYIKELSEEAIPTTTLSELTEKNVNILPIEVKTPSIKSNTSTTSTVKDLREQCKSLGIKSYSKSKKDELLELIKNKTSK